MASGLQVFDGNGTLVIDTSTMVLKELVLTTLDGSTAQSGSVAIPAFPQTNIIPVSTVNYNQSSQGANANPVYDAANRVIKYNLGGNYQSDLRILAF